MEIEKVIKQEKFKNPFQKAYINLIYTANYFRDTHVNIFASHGIQGNHFNILRILKGKYPEPVSPGYIKEVMLDKGCDLTRLVSKLVNLGFVTRGICPDNKRKMDISLTTKGYETVEQITNEVNESDMQLKTLNDKEYEILSNLLDKMRG